ncbi:MAG: lipocalin family protein [Lewinellaceae bacterium]|nr:lipocalin family protein [Saprospiraceae bacterium]MCB9341652.1 lipocalin family protein [Lewinellaceae bacterium]
MKKNYFLYLAAIAVVSFASCSKDDASVADLLKSDKGWVLKSLVSDPAINILGVQVTDVFAQYDNCFKDDITFFKDDNKVVFDEGATKCDPSDPQTTSGTWLLSSDEKVLTVDDDSQDILEISNSTLKVKFLYNDGTLNYNWTATFGHP